VVHTQLTTLKVFPESRDDTGEDEVLRKGIQAGDINDVYAPVCEGSPGKIVGHPIIGDETL
jgi:hypothetical protein